MSKDLENSELTNSIVEIAAEEITKLDDISLALIGGGQAGVAL